MRREMRRVMRREIRREMRRVRRRVLRREMRRVMRRVMERVMRRAYTSHHAIDKDGRNETARVSVDDIGEDRVGAIGSRHEECVRQMDQRTHEAFRLHRSNAAGDGVSDASSAEGDEVYLRCKGMSD